MGVMARKQLPLFPLQPQTPEEITRKTPIGATLTLFEQYLHREGKSEHTLKAFMGDMELLLERTGMATPVGLYTTTNLNEFLHWMEFGRGVPCSRKTYARRVTTLKVFFKWLRSLEAIPHDPAKAVLQRSGPAPLNEALNPMQIEACIRVARGMKRNEETDFRPELIFQLLLQTGIKKSETERLKEDDFDRSNSQFPTLLVKHEVKDMYKERRISVEPTLITLKDIYIEQYRPPKTLFTCTMRNLEYILTDIGVAANVPFKLSFEVMRWTSAVRDWRMSVAEDSIREKLGLSRISWYETSAKIRRLVEHQIEEEGAAAE
jgi:site-specific recombinase XerD